MTCPNDPRPGDPVSATYVRELVRYVRSLTPFAGPGMKIRRSSAGTHYVATATGIGRVVGEQDLSPFKIRHVVQDTDAGIPYTGWEIFLPMGCVNVNMTCEPMNVQASRTVGVVQVPIEYWYRMPFPSGPAEDGDEWVVTVHAKTYASLSGVDTLASFGNRHLLFAEIHKSVRTDQEKLDDMSVCGDDLSVDVAKIVFEDDGTDTETPVIVPTVRRTVTRPVSATVNRNKRFELIWGFSVDSSTLRLSVGQILVKNNSFTAGGASFAMATKTDVPTNSKSVWLKVSAAIQPYIGTIVCYQNENYPSASNMQMPTNIENDRGPFDIMVRIYVLDNCRVKQDERDALNNIQLYR